MSTDASQLRMLIAFCSLMTISAPAVSDPLKLKAELYRSRDGDAVLIFTDKGAVRLHCEKGGEFVLTALHGFFRKDGKGIGTLSGSDVRSTLTCSDWNGSTVCKGDFPERLRLSSVSWGQSWILVAGEGSASFSAEQVKDGLSVIRPHCFGR